MGFDMYFRGKHYHDGPDVCFRFNVFSMAWFCDYMEQRGMIFDAGKPPPSPDGDWHLMERWQYPESYGDEPPLTADQESAAKELRAATDAVLSWHGPEIPGIPMHKFWTNDGWIVTPAECEAAVRIGRQHPAPADHEEYWNQWLDYIDRASRAGGFEVH
jgi:hypothetical protein